MFFLNWNVLNNIFFSITGSKLYDKTEIKLKYLEESVTHLDSSDPGMEVNVFIVLLLLEFDHDLLNILRSVQKIF